MLRLYHFTLCTQAVILYLVALFVIHFFAIVPPWRINVKICFYFNELLFNYQKPCQSFNLRMDFFYLYYMQYNKVFDFQSSFQSKYQNTKIIKLKFSPQILFNFFCHVFKFFLSMWQDSNLRCNFQICSLTPSSTQPHIHISMNASTRAFYRKHCNTFSKLRIELKICCRFSFCGDGRSRTFAFRFSV